MANCNLEQAGGFQTVNSIFSYGHRRAVALTTHGEAFMAMVVPTEDENAVKALSDYYGDEEIVAQRIGRFKAWIRLKIRASQNRDSISQAISRDEGNRISISQDTLYSVPISIIEKTMDVGMNGEERAGILDIAAQEKGGKTIKNVDIAVHRKKIIDAVRNELQIELANKEAEKTILVIELKRIQVKIQQLDTEISELKKKVNH